MTGADAVADLHVHTTHSDGQFTPADVVRLAAAAGLSTLSITDHDTTSAVSVAMAEAERLGIELIAGIELTAEQDGHEVHLLGYFVDPEFPELVELAGRLRVARTDRFETMASRLVELGFRVDVETVRRSFPRANLGRRHLAEYLVRSRQVGSVAEVFRTVLGDGGPADVSKERLAAPVAIDLIHKAGGVAALAHPPYHLRFEALRVWKTHGLDAVETQGPSISPRLSRRWGEWARELQLLTVGGSDFHGMDGGGRIGRYRASADQVDALRRHAPGYDRLRISTSTTSRTQP